MIVVIVMGSQLWNFIAVIDSAEMIAWLEDQLNLKIFRKQLVVLVLVSIIQFAFRKRTNHFYVLSFAFINSIITNKKRIEPKVKKLFQFNLNVTSYKHILIVQFQSPSLTKINWKFVQFFNCNLCPSWSSGVDITNF